MYPTSRDKDGPQDHIQILICERELGYGSADESSFAHFSAGKSGPVAEVVLVAIGEAAVKILLLSL